MSYEADTPIPKHTPMPPSGDGGLSWWAKRWPVVMGVVLGVGGVAANGVMVAVVKDGLDEVRRDVAQRATVEAVERVREDLREHVNPRNHPDNTARVDVLIARLGLLEADLGRTKEEVRAAAIDRTNIMRKLDRLCMATPRCEP